MSIVDSFWEYSFSEAELYEIIKGSDEQKKYFVFEKILLYSRDLFRELRSFSQEDLSKFLQSFQPAQFQREHAERRKRMAEYFFLGKPLQIPELQWRV